MNKLLTWDSGCRNLESQGLFWLVGLVILVCEWILKALALGIQAMDAMINKCSFVLPRISAETYIPIEISKCQMRGYTFKVCVNLICDAFVLGLYWVE